MSLTKEFPLARQCITFRFGYQLKIIYAVLLLFLSCYAPVSHGLETSIELQKGAADSSYGINLSLAKPLYRHSNFYWQVAYNRLNNVEGTVGVVEAEGGSVTSDEFSLDTLDLAVSYVYSPKTYNKKLNKLFVEFQLGMGIAISDNEFQWVDPNNSATTYEQVLSSAGDINPMLAISIGYTLNQQTSIYLGLKSYPNYSDFDAITTLFLGGTYYFKPKRKY